MCTEQPHRWHYDYSRLAWDTGFCFDSYKTQKVFDRNGIALLDIERIIRERDIAIVDHHIQNILEYKLDIEETRILDPNFVKLFRLSQLAVEYLTYCKKYLDSTIAIIKQDLQKANEENAVLKHDLVNYQSEIHKWRKKVKDLKSTLLIHRKYQPTAAAACLKDAVATFQCNACAKVFVNDEYLKAHVTRRHSSNELERKLSETANSSPVVNTQYKAETDRLQMEIKELKEKLNSRERYFKNEEEKSMKTNEDGGTAQSEAYYKRMENLHDEFELFKTQYEAEMKVIRKGEQDKYDKWMERICDKLDTNSTKAQNVEAAENKKKPEQNADQPANIVQGKIEENKRENIIDLKCEKEEQIYDKSKVETNEDVSSEAGEIHIPARQETTIAEESMSTETKTPQEKIVDNRVGDISRVKEEVGKVLEEKTKQDIEKLGEQLSEQMSDTFGLLQTRMETFWTKLQEIEVQRDKEHTLLLTHTQQRIAQTPPTPKLRTDLPPNTTRRTKESSDNSSTQNSVSNSEESETESNCHEPQSVQPPEQPRPTTIPAHKTNEITAAVISELKTKMEQKSTKMQHILQKPNVQKIFSKPLVENAVVSSSESESTGSDSEETRSESEPVVVKQAEIIQRPTKIEEKISVTTKNTARPKAEVLQQFRKLVEEEFDERQRDLGLDPEWARLPDRTYKHKSDILTHQRTLMVKETPELRDIRENIIQKYDIQLATTDLPESPNLTPEPDVTTRPSRFKSLFLNMRNKAKSMIRQERSPPSARVNTTTGIYKLTVHRDSPERKQSVPKPTARARTNKPPRTNSKQSTMYETTDSENASEPEPRKTRTTMQGERKVLRKTKSETNMTADKPIETTQTTNSSMVRSLSNLDSILEIKKELSNVRESESSSENIRKVIAVSHVQTMEKEKCKLENVSSDMESEDLKEEKAHKSALKNYPSTVKKKVLFDLHNEEQNVEIHNDERSNEQVVDRKLVKSNSLFQNDGNNGGNDSSTSIDSDILDFHKTESKKPGSGDTISTRALINVTAKAQDDGSDWDISDIVK